MSTAAPYVIQEIGVLQGAYGVTPLAINNSGIVVGSLGTVAGTQRSFVYANGATLLLPRLPDGTGGSDAAVAINATGQIVGQSGERAYSYSGQTMTALGEPSGRVTAYPASINDRGEIVGYSFGQGPDSGFLYGGGVFQPLSGVWHAFGVNNGGEIVGDNGAQAVLYSGGEVHVLGQLAGGTGGSRALAINDAGQIVGNSDSANGWQAFLYEEGQMRALIPPGGRVSSATSINNLGQVVGSAGFVGGWAAFLLEDEEVIELSTLVANLGDWRLDVAYDVNDVGQIVGTGWQGGQQRAFLLSPTNLVSSPSTLPLVFLGIFLTIWLPKGKSRKKH